VDVLPVPVRDGYTFIGWNTEESGTGSGFTTETVVKGDLTVYAQWRQNSAVGITASRTSITGGGAVTLTVTSPDPANTTVTCGNAAYHPVRGGDGAWSVTLPNATASYTFTASANQSYMAVFEKQEDAPPTPSAYTINVHASPAAGGTVSGGGTYQSGKAVTLTAAANTGYRFVEWQSGGTRVSTSARYTFYASANQTYTAIFEEQSETPRPVYTITVNANPAAGGSVSGGGRFEKGTSVTVVATASSSYRFAGWFENGAQVSAALSYTFTASVDRALTASFVYTGSDAGNTPGDEPNDNTHAGNSSSSNTPTAKPPLPVSTNSTSDAVTTTASPDAAITGTTAVTTISSEVAAEIIKQAVRAVRNIRNDSNVPPSRRTTIYVVSEKEDIIRTFTEGRLFFASLAYANEVKMVLKTGEEAKAITEGGQAVSIRAEEIAKDAV